MLYETIVQLQRRNITTVESTTTPNAPSCAMYASGFDRSSKGTYPTAALDQVCRPLPKTPLKREMCASAQLADNTPTRGGRRGLLLNPNFHHIFTNRGLRSLVAPVKPANAPKTC